jgi:hypothetical protein
MPANALAPVTRPVWRSFRSAYLTRALAHVRAGGIAAVIDRRGNVKLLLPLGRDGRLTEMSQWALLALEIHRWGRAGRSAGRTVASVRLQKKHVGFVREWCERDAGEPRSTRIMRLDCLACGACCRENRVVLEPSDLTRWRRAGRDDLLGRDYIRRRDGVVLLKLRKDASCVHLGAANRCSIYELRPDNCSSFPPASEACLAARLETLGIVD